MEIAWGTLSLGSRKWLKTESELAVIRAFCSQRPCSMRDCRRRGIRVRREARRGKENPRWTPKETG